MIYEPLSPSYKVRQLVKRFSWRTQDAQREYSRRQQDLSQFRTEEADSIEAEYNERQAELSRDHAKEVIEINKEYNIAKDKLDKL